MSETVIELDEVGKRYRLGEHHGAGTDLREKLVQLGGRLRRREHLEHREIWSLKDISFSVNRGEAVGVLGANGAGKSTLLKVISNITTPTVGRSRTLGRVGSLLEVGTGFHGELTGLENTFLNGAILGMSRRDVARRLDEIVEFAGLAKFMDTPVKRYSSGMYLRLGFAIAAHMEAEILLVDEVLAVGDVEFQRRCLGKMGEIEQSGRTVLFVTHNLEAMARLCPRAIWLDRGSIRSDGPTESVIEEYLRSTPHQSVSTTLEPDARQPARLNSVALVDEAGRPMSIATTRTAAWVEIDIDVVEEVPGLDVAIMVSSSGGVDLLDEGLADTGRHDISRRGRYRVRAEIPAVLAPGEYRIGVWLGSAYEDYALVENAVALYIEGELIGRTRRRVRVDARWDLTRIDDDAHAPRDAGDPESRQRSGRRPADP